MNNDEYRDSENEAKGFKVIDRRRFDEMGEERDKTECIKGESVLSGQNRDTSPPMDAWFGRTPSEEMAQKGATGPTPESTDSNSGGSANSSKLSHSNEQPPFDFSVFIMSLADQALWQLGVNAPPEGIDIPADPVAAKQTIDIVAMIEIKTRGNRDAMEERLIKAVLHELRMAYLKTSR